MFINFSNHPSQGWDSVQMAEAQSYGQVMDIAFPNIDVNASDEELDSLAEKYIDEIMSYSPEAVMVQGDFIFSFLVVNSLLKRGVIVLAAATKRVTKETKVDGVFQKTSIFKFEKFRQYHLLSE